MAFVWPAAHPVLPWPGTDPGFFFAQGCGNVARDDSGLTDLQRRFCREYLIDRNAGQAYKRAGYRPKNDNVARVSGHRLLTKANVAAEIAKLETELADRTKLTAENVLEEIRRVAFVDRRKLASWGPDGVKWRPSEDLTEEEAAIVESISETVTASGGTIKIKTASKNTALDKLARYFGLYKDRDPLDVLLESLPLEFAAAVRTAIAEGLPAGGTTPGGQSSGATPVSP